MKQKMEEIQTVEVNWYDLLYEKYDFVKECKEIFPINPPKPCRCENMQDHLINISPEAWGGEKYGVIEITDNGIANYNLPLVAVVGPYGEKRDIKDYSYHNILNMPIYVSTKKPLTGGQIMTLICFYLTYPLRVERQKKRDAISMFLNVVCQKKQMEEKRFGIIC